MKGKKRCRKRRIGEGRKRVKTGMFVDEHCARYTLALVRSLCGLKFWPACHLKGEDPKLNFLMSSDKMKPIIETKHENSAVEILAH